jgi:hypothetical protein
MMMLSSLFRRFIILFFITLLKSEGSFALFLPTTISDLHHQHLYHEWPNKQPEQHDPLHGEQYLRLKRSSLLPDDDSQVDKMDFVELARLVDSTQSEKDSRSTSSLSPEAPARIESTTTTSLSNDQILNLMMINDKDNLMKKPTNKNKSSIDEDGDDGTGNRRTLPRNQMPSFLTLHSSSFSTTPPLPTLLNEEEPHLRRTTRSRGSSAIDDDDDDDNFNRRPVRVREDDTFSSSLSGRRIPSSSSSSSNRKLTSPGNFLRRQRQQTSANLLPTPPPFESHAIHPSRINQFTANRFTETSSNTRSTFDHFQGNNNRRQEESFNISNHRDRDPDSEDDADLRRSTIDRDRLPNLMKEGSLPMAPWEKKRTTARPTSGKWIARLMNPLNRIFDF